MQNKTIVVKEDEKGQRLDVFLMDKFPEFSRSHIKNMIENGDILTNGKISKAGLNLKVGMKIEVTVKEPEKISTEAEKVDFEIVYEDDDLAVINKPQGLVVHPCSSTKSGTLVNGLLLRLSNLSGINGQLRPGIVHRLDKDTSGLLVVAKNDFAHLSLAEQIKNKSCHRNYLAILEGNLKENEGRVQTFIKRDPKDRKKMSVQDSGRVAITDFKVSKRFEKCCLVEFSLQTGRTHQIRVHAKYLGHSVVGDKTYGHEVKDLNGQLLHAYKLSFTHPRTQDFMTFEAKLPDYFEDYLKKQKEI
ncbi:MAG: RluA family pseudouridine synthase [Candidatus Caccovivens sp.]